MQPREATWVRALRGVAVAVVVALAALGTVRVWSEGGTVPAQRAADALPVYLSGAALHDGQDPTTQEGLQRAYDAREMSVRAATFSNLYPATTGVLVRPLARGTWEAFLSAWRALLLLGGVVGGAAGGFAAARGRNAGLAAAIGAWCAVSAFPVTGECIALGQANLLVGGLLGVAMAAISRGWGGVAAGAAVLGGGLKLVPAIVGWTLLTGRRWRAVGIAVLLGIVLTAVTLTQVPLDRVVSGVLGTLRFQGAIAPGWLTDPRTPAWMRTVGDLRHTSAMVITLAVTAVVAWTTAATLPPRAPATHAGWRPLAATVALATAWLAADASGFHVLYAPLGIPAVAFVALWPLDDAAPRWSLPFVLAAGVPAALLAWPLAGVPEEARLVLAGMVIWAAVLVRVLVESPPLSTPRVSVVGVALGWGIAHALSLSLGPRGPDPASVPGGDVTGLGLPEGVGHGGPEPGARPGVPPLAEGAQPPAEVPASLAPVGTGSSSVRLEEILEPEQAARLTGHLVQSPQAWAKVDGPLPAWLAATAPQPPAALVTVGELAQWMAWEWVATEQVPGAEAQASRLDRTWRVLTADAKATKAPPR